MKKKLPILALLSAALTMIVAATGLVTTLLSGQPSPTLVVTANTGGIPPATMDNSAVAISDFTMTTAPITIAENSNLDQITSPANVETLKPITLTAGTTDIAGTCNTCHDSARDPSSLESTAASMTPTMNSTNGYADNTPADNGSEGNYHTGKIVATSNINVGSMTSAIT